MPTVLYLDGWRFFFYANEKNEPIHIHAQKAEMECKYWLLMESFDIREAITFNMKPKDKRQVKRIIFQHFDYLAEQWNEFHKK